MNGKYHLFGNLELTRARVQQALHSMLWVLLCLGLAFGTGCGTSITVKDTVYLDDLNLSGPTVQPPVHLADEREQGSVRISPQVSINNTRNVAGRISGSSSYSKSRFGVDNFQWSIPTSRGGIDLDYRYRKSISITGGLNYSLARKNLEKNGFWGGNLGVGYVFDGQGVRARVDAGVVFQQLTYDASSILVRQVSVISPFGSGSSTDTTSFLDHATFISKNYHIELTVNSVKPEWPVNVFGQLAVGIQTLADFEPGTTSGAGINITGGVTQYTTTDARAQTRSTYLAFTPGVYFNLGESARLLGGVRVIKHLEIDGFDGLILAPMLKLDVTL